MANRSYSSLLRHLDGVGALLRARGIKNITTSTSRRTFYEYRSIKLSLDLATRRASFLSTLEWIDPPWKALEPHSANNLQTVSDIAFRIPLAMEKLDHAHNALHLKIPDVGWDDAILRSLILEALSIHSALEKWVYRLSSDRQPPYYTTRPARTTKSSIIDSIMNIYPISFEFPNWDSASSFVYHSMSQIYINSLLLDLEHLAQTSSPPGSKMGLPQINARELIEQSIECADRICQSIEYFLEDNKRLIGRMVVLAPFETTRSLFNQLSKSGTGNAEKDISLLEKVGFCDAVTQRIKDSGLPIG
jgi:hypothetical protein